MNKISLMVLVMLLCGCVYEVRQSQIKNVTQIMFVNAKYYHVFCEDPHTKEVTTQVINGEIKIFADVSEFEPMWVDVETGMSNRYIIHIHSTNDIAGGETGGKHSSPIRPLIQQPPSSD